MPASNETYHFCTIHGYTYIPYLLVQLDSIERKVRNPYFLWVLCVDYETYHFIKVNQLRRIIPLYWRDISDRYLLSQRRKFGYEIGKFCWSSKPIFMQYLFKKYKFKKVLYVDVDMVLLSNPKRIFDKYLLNYDICLAPHYFSPHVRYLKRKCGTYNAGLIGVTNQAIKFLKWWQDRCYERCEQNNELIPAKGGFYDQGYLDRVRQKFKKVKILEREYNVAPWNLYNINICNKKIFVGKRPIVFYHFHLLKIDNWKIQRQCEGTTYKIDSVISLYQSYQKTLVKFEKQYGSKSKNKLISFLTSESILEVLSVFYTVIDKSPRDIFRIEELVNILYILASRYKLTGKKRKAEEYFRYIAQSDVLISDGLRGGAYFHLGELMLKQRRRNIARQYFQECLLRIPDHNKACEYLSQIDKNTILVSAIVSTYNAEKFIKGCLQDLVNQTLYKIGGLEIVVINSNSMQDEDSIIKVFQQKYQNIVYIKTKKLESIYTAWNRAIQKARGAYITNANTDDRHKNDALEIMADVLEKNNDIDMVYAWQWITNIPNQRFKNFIPLDVNKWHPTVREKMIAVLRNNENIKITKNKDDEGWCLQYPYYSKHALKKRCLGSQPLWRKRLHDAYGYFDERFEMRGDYEFWLRLMNAGAQFQCIPQILGVFYLSGENKEFEYNEQREKETYWILGKYYFNFKHTRNELGQKAAVQNQETLDNISRYPNKFIKYCELALKMKDRNALIKELSFVFNFLKVKKISSENFFYEMATIYEKLGLFYEARNFYLKELKYNYHNNHEWQIYIRLGNLVNDVNKHKSQGYFLKALDILQTKKQKSDVERYAIASLYKQLGNITKAKSWFNRIIMYSSEANLIPKSHFHMGECLLWQRQKEKARRHLLTCTRLLPCHQKAKKYLASL